MDSKGKGTIEDISPIESPVGSPIHSLVNRSTISEPTIQFMAMDDYSSLEPDSLGILPRDAEAWEPPRGNLDNWGSWAPLIPETGWDEIPQSPIENIFDKE
jgi:hypothetical protein